MMRNISALFVGVVFGLGLTVSQMTNPAKVVGFLDFFGSWDPSLLLVMGGALIVTTIGYRFVTKQNKPLFASNFHFPTTRNIDSQLILGSVLFGIGWGLVGLCPGPAIAAVSIGGLPILVFLFAMAAGVYLFEIVNKLRNNPSNKELSKTS